VKPLNQNRQRITVCAGCGAPMRINKNAVRHVACDVCRGLNRRQVQQATGRR
jgi:hypothetical protein